MLKAVTFDCWGTLIMEASPGLRQTRTERIRKIGETLQEKGIFKSPDDIDRAYDALGKQLVQLWDEHRDIGARTQVEWLLNNLEAPKQLPDSLIDRLVEAYTFPILSDLPVPVDGALGVLSALQHQGFRIAVICNTGRTPGKVLRIILDRLGLGTFFSVQTYSDEVELRKPRPEIFLQTLSALGVAPSEALHIGDTLSSDVAGADGVGMRSVHLCHPRGADKLPGDGVTISALPDLLPIVNLQS
jgi:putative hydrolase of the HAD superfamily